MYLPYLSTRSIHDIVGLRFWGSPVTPRFCSWAFNADRGAPIRRYWDAIAPDVDVLVTHGPPKVRRTRLSVRLRDEGRRHTFGNGRMHESVWLSWEGPVLMHLCQA